MKIDFPDPQITQCLKTNFDGQWQTEYIVSLFHPIKIDVDTTLLNYSSSLNPICIQRDNIQICKAQFLPICSCNDPNLLTFHFPLPALYLMTKILHHSFIHHLFKPSPFAKSTCLAQIREGSYKNYIWQRKEGKRGMCEVVAAHIYT